ncbi:MAG TPA: hypothetical protein VLI05_04700 [Candidatus Saccharimonadia bacterium]|nr:hypothetical protein [Candidatus Saccharimonadia bacterium]
MGDTGPIRRVLEFEPPESPEITPAVEPAPAEPAAEPVPVGSALW